MPALVAGIHVLCISNNEDVDGRDKPGHDGMRGSGQVRWPGSDDCTDTVIS